MDVGGLGVIHFSVRWFSWKTRRQLKAGRRGGSVRERCLDTKSHGRKRRALWRCICTDPVASRCRVLCSIEKRTNGQQRVMMGVMMSHNDKRRNGGMRWDASSMSQCRGAQYNVIISEIREVPSPAIAGST